MSDFDTLKAIRDNCITILTGMGIKFTSETNEDDFEVPASTLPRGYLFERDALFENTHGQRSSYAERVILIRVYGKTNDSRVNQDFFSLWITNIRTGLTVNALNIGDLVSSKLVSLVTTESIEIDNSNNEGLSFLDYEVLIRYREA